MRRTASRRGLVIAVWMLAVMNRSCMLSHYPADYRPDGADAAIFAQAQAVDSLESRIEQYGSIVAKPADVWGQARLMLHRNEFEEAMRKEAGNFKVAFEQEVVGHDSTSIAGQLNLAGLLAPASKPAASKIPAAQAKPAETDAKKSTAAAKEPPPPALHAFFDSCPGSKIRVPEPPERAAAHQRRRRHGRLPRLFAEPDSHSRFHFARVADAPGIWCGNHVYGQAVSGRVADAANHSLPGDQRPG